MRYVYMPSGGGASSLASSGARHAAGLRFCPHGNDQNLRGRGPILVPAALPAVVWSREAGWRNESSINRAGPFVPRVHRWIKGRFVY